MQQRTFLFKLILWAIPMALLLVLGTLILGGEFWEILGLSFFLFGIIPKILGMLFTIPFAIHTHRSLTERHDGRILVDQGQLWQSLRVWLIAWLLLGVLAFAGGAISAPVKSGEYMNRALFVWGCHGGIVLLFFYAPLIYQMIAALLIAPHCRNFGFIISGMILMGITTYVMIIMTVFFLIEMRLNKLLKFTLPNAGYNPGFPEPEAALCYTSLLGAGLLWWTIRSIRHPAKH